MTRRLLRAFAACSATDVAAGLVWYPQAASTARQLAREYGIAYSTAVDVIAVLSPRARWESNVALAWTVVDAWVAGRTPDSVRGYMGQNIRKAFRILDGDRDALRGKKVTAFARNIDGDPDTVTVDGWAARIAVGRKCEPTDRQYERIAASYTAAAARVGLAPRDLQAILWVAARGRAH